MNPHPLFRLGVIFTLLVLGALSAPLANIHAANKPPLPRISAEQAMTIAMNELASTTDGVHLKHPRHTADFDAHGVLFQPRGGGPAWHWQLTHIGAPDAPLANIARAGVVPTQSAPRRVVYERGGVVEQYLAQQNGIEQQFILAQPLALNGGNLVVEGHITSAGEFASSADGWQWRDAGGAVRLGKVRVFDANGKLLPATMRVAPFVEARDAMREARWFGRESALTTLYVSRITIAGSALAAAAYPVTIDPEIGAGDFRISDMGPDGDTNYRGKHATVAFNNQENEYLVVWQGDDEASGEGEIYGQRIDAVTGAEVGTNDFRISDMGPDGTTDYNAYAAVVAYNSADNQYLVAWYGDDNTGGLVDNELEIFGQRIDATTGAEIGANDFRISEMGPNGSTKHSAIGLAVVYNTNTSQYLVVWAGDDNPLVDDENDDEWEIFGQLIEADSGNEIGTNDFRISDMGPDGDPDYGAFEPAVAYNSTDNEYLVVWYGDDNTGALVDNEVEIFGQRLDAWWFNDLAEIGANDFRISQMGPNGDTDYSVYAPAIAYNDFNNEYLVVWQGDDNTAPLVNWAYEIFGQRINAATGALVGANGFRISYMGPEGNIEYGASEPDVTYNGANNEYLVVWKGDDDIAPLVDEEFEIFGQRLDAATGNAMGASGFRISNMGPDGDPGYGAEDPATAYNPIKMEYLIVWHGDDNTWPLVDDEFEIFGERRTAGCSVKPTKPTLTSPAKDAKLKTARPTLKWEAANCADTYKVTVKDAATNKKVDSKAGLTALQYKTKTLTRNKTYKWVVEACNAVGCTKSATWKFFIKP